MDTIKAAEIRSIFGKNLRKLCGEHSSISAVARDLSLNRTQLNRYLNGESHPKPDVLFRICKYFDTDARILTQDLSELKIREKENYDNNANVFNIFGPHLKYDEFGSLKTGIYKYWKRSFLIEDCCTLSLFLVYEVGGLIYVKGVMGFEVISNNKAAKVKTPAIGLAENLGVRTKGVLLKQPTGYLFLLESLSGSPALVSGYLAPHRMTAHILCGRTMVASDRGKNTVRTVSPCVMERSKQDFRTVRQLRRQVGYHPEEEVPEYIRELL